MDFKFLFWKKRATLVHHQKQDIVGKNEPKLDLLIPKALILLYLIIGLVPRFKAVDPIGSQWFYFSVINLLGLFYVYANSCLLYTSPSPRDQRGSRMPSSA